MVKAVTGGGTVCPSRGQCITRNTPGAKRRCRLPRDIRPGCSRGNYSLEDVFSKGIDSVELTESFSSFSSPTPSRRLVNQHREEIHLRFAYRTFLPESYVPP